MLKQRSKGFTLIELIFVIIIVGIVAISTTQFIKSSAEIYITAVKRDKVMGHARFALVRLGKELRRATPNSIRVTESADSTNPYQCLEFAPIKASSIYINGSAQSSVDEDATQLEVVINNGIQIDEEGSLVNLVTENDLVAIYPQSAADIYDASSNRVHKLKDAPELKQVNKTQTWSFESEFERDSPTRRLFVLEPNPVSICKQLDGLYYYSGYEYLDTQPTPSAAHMLAENPGQLLAKNIINPQVFLVDNPSLVRNAIVKIRLKMTVNENESLTQISDVFIPNSP